MKQEWIKMFVPVFEGNDPPADPPTDPPADPPTDTFTKEQVEKIVQERLATSSKAMEKIKGEVDALRQRSNMSAQEKKELEDRLEQIQNETLTKEQLAANEKKKADSAHKKQVESLTADAQKWQKLHTDSTIERDLLDAAVDNDAFKPSQLVQLLRTQSALVDELDAEKQPTGRLVTQVTIEGKDEKGKSVTLKLSAKDAIKQMKDMEEYENLFKYEGSGGFGNTNRSTGGSGNSNAKELAKTDMKTYMEKRTSGEIEI